MEIHVRRMAMTYGQMSIHRKLGVINSKSPALFFIPRELAEACYRKASELEPEIAPFRINHP